MNVHEDVRNGNIYLYKLVCDNGGAPCVHRGVLSLAICKPGIRKVAKEGDWIIGFGGKSVPELKGRLIYVARLTSVEVDGAYYKDPRYRGRPDRVYRVTDSGYQHIGSGFHDRSDLPHDMGSPPKFERARVLLSDTFAYFGRNEETSIGDVKDIYDELPRNFTRNHMEQTRERLECFIVSVFEQFGPGEHGEPTQGDHSLKCHGGDQDDDDMVAIPRCSP
jgi:hypothetical protein